MTLEFIDKLHKHIDEGNVSQQMHPTELLTIFNYTNQCQYASAWDEVTLQCRGLILGGEYELVSRPFKKFFSLDQLGPEYVLPNTSYQIFKKYDGSCLISYWLNGRLYWATRGSFTSDQANWANEIWQEKYSVWNNVLTPNFTYVAELIHPQNRIVVDYGDTRDIIFTAIIDTKHGGEISLDWLDLPQKPKLSIAERYPGDISPYKLKELEIPNEEGYVIKYANDFRVKVKFEEYQRLHKITTNTTSYDIWEALKEGRGLDEILDRVPDEFFSFVENTVEGLHEEYNRIYSEICEAFEGIPPGDRKTKAEYIKTTKYPAILFGLIDGKDLEPMIWPRIKPTFQKPFSNEYKSERRAGEVPAE